MDEESFDKRLGRVVHALREQRDVTQGDLAGAPGLNRPQNRELEGAKRKQPSADTVRFIARTLPTSSEAIYALAGSETSTPDEAVGPADLPLLPAVRVRVWESDPRGELADHE